MIATRIVSPAGLPRPAQGVASGIHPRVLAGPSFTVLDGGLATELERDGFDLDHPLWSARVLVDAPDAVVAVHRRFLEAGADLIIAASYQAAGPAMLRQAVALARQAAGGGARVAASVGPYGASLADGSEYHGRYGVRAEVLRAYHEPRLAVLDAAGADVLAVETLPSRQEVEVLLELLAAASTRSWVSVTCTDGGHLRDGTPLGAVARAVEGAPGVMALGINCTAPRHVLPLLERARAAGLTKPAVVYPNSGEHYEPATRGWRGEADPTAFADLARAWHAAGARGIGGCCRTGPAHVRALRALADELRQSA